MGDSPEGSPTENAPLRYAPPAGGGSAYAGSLAPALRGIDLPGRGRGSSEGMGWEPGEDPPRIRERIGERTEEQKGKNPIEPDRIRFFPQDDI